MFVPNFFKCKTFGMTHPPKGRVVLKVLAEFRYFMSQQKFALRVIARNNWLR